MLLIWNDGVDCGLCRRCRWSVGWGSMGIYMVGTPHTFFQHFSTTQAASFFTYAIVCAGLLEGKSTIRYWSARFFKASECIGAFLGQLKTVLFLYLRITTKHLICKNNAQYVFCLCIHSLFPSIKFNKKLLENRKRDRTIIYRLREKP